MSNQTMLSILIPARHEEFLAKTVENILENIEAETEIIVVLDGEPSMSPLPEDPRVHVISVSKAFGQRAATNLAARMAVGKYVVKVDAHCAFDKGFDRKMLEFHDIVGDNVTSVAIMRNLWAFDWKCLTKGTKIITPNGLRNIEEIKKGEEIISGDGKPHKVNAVMTNDSLKAIVRVKPYHLPAIELTSDHLVKVYPYEYKKITVPNSHITIISEKEKWIKAGELKNGLYKMIYPFSQEEKLGLLAGCKNKEQIVKFLGYFMAEGNFYHKNSSGEYFNMTLCFNQDEDHIVDEIETIMRENFTNRFGKKVTVKRIKKTDKRSGYKYMRVEIFSKDATRFFRRFIIGENARNKKFIPEVLLWPKKLQRILIDAMIEGDGWIGMVRETPVVTYDTSSKELSNQVFTMMLRLGYRPGITERINFSNFGTKNPSYSIRAYTNNNGKNNKGIIRGNEYVVSVYDIKEVDYNGFVYDLSIDGLPEILTESGIVHNCYHCGWKVYQGSTPEKCGQCGKTDRIRKKIVWIGKSNPQSTSYCFDSEPHFQYNEDYKHREPYLTDKKEKGYTETMSLQGSFFMCTREKYWELKMGDESFGSWGSQGIQIACSTWLSGGRVLVNHNTWYAHLFRTKGGTFGFPYPQSGRQVQAAKKHAKNLIYKSGWPNQILPTSWLIKKFMPLRGWKQEDLDNLIESESSIPNL